MRGIVERGQVLQDGFMSIPFEKIQLTETGALPLVDTMGRPLRDLRISVTDRCNLRCTYCMPRAVFDENHPFLPRAELLSFEEIERLAQQFVRLGVRKIRLTGGEPLLRRGIEQLVERLARLQTAGGAPVEIALTTNGVLLAKKAQALKDAGLARITVSLDGLSDSAFRRMSDANVPVRTVLDGIAEAQRVGLAPVKVNMVVRRGVNESSIVPMARWARETGVTLRFIEYMDVGHSNGWRLDEVVSAQELIDTVSAVWPTEPADPGYRGEVAGRWRYVDGLGEFGIISSVTRPFCRDCTRARLSADGKLYTCLFAVAGLDVRAVLRDGSTDEQLVTFLADAWRARDDRYSELRSQSTSDLPKVEMFAMGG